jgi:urease subunit gamma
MHLTPREIEKLLIYQMADIAERRKAKGLKLNHPESMALICAAALEGAREGKSVEDVMKEAAQVLTRDDVMEGVAEMIPFVQLEAIFTDGTRLITVHEPIK